jgi:hypothetical protein
MEATPTTRTTRVWPYRESAKELVWLFTSGDAVMGYRAQSYEPTGGSWDLASSHAAHMAKLRLEHSEDLDKHARVSATLAQMVPEVRRRLRLVYRPKQWPLFIASAVRDYDKRQGCLVGLVLETEAVHVAYDCRYKRAPPNQDELLKFLATEATTDLRRFIFRPAVEEARKMRDDALEPYELLRAQRVASFTQATKAAKAGDLARLRSGGAAS